MKAWRQVPWLGSTNDKVACRRIIAATTALPLLKGSVKAMVKTIVVAQRFLVRFGLRSPPPEIESFDSGSVRFVLSAKNRCIVAAHDVHNTIWLWWYQELIIGAGE